MRQKRLNRWMLAAAVLLLGAATFALAGDEPAQALWVGHQDGDAEVRVMALGGGRLGVHVRDVTAEEAGELKLAGAYGAVIEELEEDSPAAKAGLQAKDVIVAFDGERVRSVEHLRRLVRETPGGRTVAIEVSRNGQKQAFQIAPEERRLGRFEVPVPALQLPRIEVPRIEALPDMNVFVMGGPRLGISGDELTAQLASFFGVEGGKGVLVREVVEGSAAAKAGLKAGDVIVAVDGKNVADVNDLRDALRKTGESTDVTLTIVRDRRQQSLKVTLEKPTTWTPRRTAEFNIEIDPGVVVEVDPEAMQDLAEEMQHVTRELRHELEYGYQEQRRELRQQLREAEKQAREALKQQKELQKQIEKKLKQELRHEGMGTDGAVII